MYCATGILYCALDRTKNSPQSDVWQAYGISDRIYRIPKARIEAIASIADGNALALPIEAFKHSDNRIKGYYLDLIGIITAYAVKPARGIYSDNTVEHKARSNLIERYVILAKDAVCRPNYYHITPRFKQRAHTDTDRYGGYNSLAKQNLL